MRYGIIRIFKPGCNRLVHARLQSEFRFLIVRRLMKFPEFDTADVIDRHAGMLMLRTGRVFNESKVPN